MRGLTGPALPSTSAAPATKPQQRTPSWAAAAMVARNRLSGGLASTSHDLRRRRRSQQTSWSSTPVVVMSLFSSSSSSGNSQPPHSGGSGTGGSSSGSGRRRKRPGLFEVLVETPPPRSLGLHHLPPDTHNGDRIEIDERAYVVRRLVLRYRLEKGRYVPATQAVEVASQGRFLVDEFLNQLVEK